MPATRPRRDRPAGARAIRSGSETTRAAPERLRGGDERRGWRLGSGRWRGARAGAVRVAVAVAARLAIRARPARFAGPPAADRSSPADWTPPRPEWAERLGG